MLHQFNRASLELACALVHFLYVSYIILLYALLFDKNEKKSLIDSFVEYH